jgi:hypothetical protein
MFGDVSYVPNEREIERDGEYKRQQMEASAAQHEHADEAKRERKENSAGKPLLKRLLAKLRG